ncbi:hypothetical protein D1816_00970 [Aquimarina sp. AD10]|uniref:DUF5829 family protein n=1 Tax=Aquimarina sp. AD10 TaxID=1714849 RepID=UPI000E501CBA|nr:DUF5829 family protein [Aquimarina sp. AD10]AXT58981.1 hypothetical protein D1816_00970 [Aquimarina sp. AD10]RKM95076.1 hypothetical protein D7033_17435 [Aquimarina sp. AD10]
MFQRIAICLILLLSFDSCITQEKKENDNTIIDRKKIDAVFNKDISKVLLDHLYVVVDSITYTKLTKDNQWKNKYGSLDSGLPDFAPVHDKALTCFLRGHQHYIEILSPKNSYNEPIGKSGIGFSLKNKNEHFHLGVKPRLKITKNSFLYATETVKMPLRNHKHTWFKAFYTPSPGTALHTWYGFYNPTFLDSLYGNYHATYSREAFLEPVYTDQKLFNAIKEIYLNCTLNDYRRIIQELNYLGCKFLEKKGNILTIASEDIIINIQPSDQIEYSRITKIICRLNDKDDSITQLGNVTITNQGTESIWDFDELYRNNP